MPANGGANCTTTSGCNVTTEGGILTETCVVTNCTPCTGGGEEGDICQCSGTCVGEK